MGKRDIKDFTLTELTKTVIGLGEPAYRAEQVFRWLYQKGVSDFNKISDIPAALRDKLEKVFYVGGLKLHQQLASCDGTEKYLFQLGDGNFIESVLIPAAGRKTVCLSSQVGCRFACPFCASGAAGFRRNLSPGEITGQALFLRDNLKHNITNYVFMGMGEPLDNFENVKKALLIMNDSKGMDIGARRITLSTCGLIPGIERLAQLGLQVNLSISLHATNDRLRNALAPVNKRYPLAELIKACKDYIEKTGRMVTLEYVLIKNKNDSPQDAEGLAGIAKLLKAKVNLIAYSQIAKQRFQSPGKEDIELFMKRLQKKAQRQPCANQRVRIFRRPAGSLPEEINNEG